MSSRKAVGLIQNVPVFWPRRFDGERMRAAEVVQHLEAEFDAACGIRLTLGDHIDRLLPTTADRRAEKSEHLTSTRLAG